MKNSLKILNRMIACRVSLQTCGHKLKSFIFAFQFPLILLGKIESKIWAPKPRRSLGSRHSQAKLYFLIRVPCVCCHIAEGSIKHIFWFCPKLHNFWSAIFEHLPVSFSLTVTRPSLDALPRLPASRMTRRPLCTSGCWWQGHLFLKPESQPLHPLMLTCSVTQMERPRLHTPNVRQNPGIPRVPVTVTGLNFLHEACFTLTMATMLFPKFIWVIYNCLAASLMPPFPFHLFSFMFDYFLWHVL